MTPTRVVKCKWCDQYQETSNLLLGFSNIVAHKIEESDIGADGLVKTDVGDFDISGGLCFKCARKISNTLASVEVAFPGAVPNQ